MVHMMTYLYRFLLLALFALLGGFLYAVSINLLIGTGAFSNDQISNNIGYFITEKAVYIWLSSIVIGGLSLLTKKKWGYVFLSLPFWTPSIFAFIYTLLA